MSLGRNFSNADVMIFIFIFAVVYMVLSMQILLLEDHQYTIDVDAIDTKLISFVLVMLSIQSSDLFTVE